MSIRLLSTLVHFLFPSSCDFCAQPLKKNAFNRICLICLAKINLENFSQIKNYCPICYNKLVKEECFSCQSLADPFIFNQNKSLFYYESLAKKMLTQYKFDRHHSYAKVIAYLVIKKFRFYIQFFDYLIPITLGKKGLFERDFCPVNSVVKLISQNLKIKPVYCIKRNEENYTESQHKKNLKDRQTNINQKYFFVPKYINRFNQKKVLIVDDVFTTGSTLNAVAKLILENNLKIKEVSTLTFYRTTFNSNAWREGLIKEFCNSQRTP